MPQIDVLLCRPSPYPYLNPEKRVENYKDRRLVLRAGFEPANPCGKGYPIPEANQTKLEILSPSPLT
jgi:hypothetical protein